MRDREKSQRNQKSDNGARGKTFRLAGASQRESGGRESISGAEAEEEEEEGVRGRKTRRKRSR